MSPFFAARRLAFGLALGAIAAWRYGARMMDSQSPRPVGSIGPFFCVMVKSVEQGDETLASVTVSQEPCWLLDAGALDQLSPPWLREGSGSSIERLSKLVERFGDHCAQAAGRAAPDANVGSQVVLCPELSNGLLIVAMGLHHEADQQTADRARASFFKAAQEEIETLRKLAAPLLPRVAIRPWPEAPESARSEWALIALGAKESAYAPWGQEMASALEAEELSKALDGYFQPGERRGAL